MGTETAISIREVSKAYRIWATPASRLVSPLLSKTAGFLPSESTLARSLTTRAASHYRDFWALKNISFELKKGESLGIIGRNGSGKSTLLQIIAGTLQPTTGSVQVNGRVAALLELGSGFNPEFTGRENVYLNGAVLGLSRSEMDARFDEIAAFADIGDFIDQPVKTYSSGMMVRLAFAVATSVSPDLLIVDEALSVGDVFFQQKCFKRVHSMMENGVSLLFVSHDTAAVQNLCDRAVLLVQGEQKYAGPPEEAVSRYYSISEPMGSTPISRSSPSKASADRDQWQQLLDIHNIRTSARSEHGAMELTVEKIAIFNAKQEPSRDFKVGETVYIVALLRASKDIGNPSSGLHFYDRMNNLVFAAGTRQLRIPFSDFAVEESRLVEFQLELNVHPGEYTFSVGCSQASAEGPNLGYIQHRLEGLGPITISAASATNAIWPFYGIARLPLKIEIHG